MYTFLESTKKRSNDVGSLQRCIRQSNGAKLGLQKLDGAVSTIRSLWRMRKGQRKSHFCMHIFLLFIALCMRLARLLCDCNYPERQLRVSEVVSILAQAFDQRAEVGVWVAEEYSYRAHVTSTTSEFDHKRTFAFSCCVFRWKGLLRIVSWTNRSVGK